MTILEIGPRRKGAKAYISVTLSEPGMPIPTSSLALLALLEGRITCVEGWRVWQVTGCGKPPRAR